MQMISTLLRMLFVSVVLFSTAIAAGPANFMMRARVDGRDIEGRPLSWDDQYMLLLGRDGALHEFHPAEAEAARKTSSQFAAYSASEMAANLRTEFPDRFDVSVTPHFVVAHPPEDGRAWADRLESLYRSFSHYLGVRGFAPREPSIPLPAVVFRNQSEFHQHALKSGSRLPPGTLGYYNLKSNRMFLYDTSGGGGDWSLNSETIIHEAVHQSAYNIGVHNRLADQPRWVVEGLAMMFEAPGVWNAAAARTPSDRINNDRLQYFRRTNDARSSDWLTRMVADDRTFRIDALKAYSEAWTLTYFLCETRPREYCAYLKRVAARPPLSDYSTGARMADFSAHFGRDVAQLESQLQQYVATLP